MGQHDPLLKDALMNIIEREHFIKSVPDDEKAQGQKKPGQPAAVPAPNENDPTVVTELIKKSQASIEELKHNIQAKSGTDLIDFILEDIQELKRILFDPHSSAVFMAAFDASDWLNKHMEQWLGEKTQQTHFLNLCNTMSLLKWVWLYWMSPMSFGPIQRSLSSYSM